MGENSVARDALLVFAGNASRGLAAAICQHLDVPLGHAEVRQFSDGETQVEIHDNVRGGDVFVVQSTSTPGNDHIMELLLLLDALKRASAKRVTAVIPYYGYARQDRKVAPRVPISAKLVADLLETAGASRVMTLELHAGQIQGFFNVPVDNLYSNPVLLPPIFDELEGIARSPSCRPTPAAWSVPAHSPSGSTRRWRSSTSAACARIRSRRCASSAT